METKPHTDILNWLYACCFLLFAMAVIGAITRLTESGLSITEWKPISGALPPLSESEWQRVFDLYKQSPEFAQKHSWMELSDFKKIFFWEWLHRLWGRAIGLVYALPLLYFWVRNKIPAGFKPRLVFILLLGALQGVLGWWMVASGLIDRPSVSHYRLAAHLLLALIIFAAIWWTALDIKHGKKPLYANIFGLCSTLLLLMTITWGAFTAGLDAGLVYNTFPLMNGGFLPPETLTSFLDQQAFVQFTHRWLAIATGVALIALSYRARDLALTFMVFVQIGLGIATLLSQVYLPLAVLHQAGAVILLALTLRATHR